MYHVAPFSARARIRRDGLVPADRRGVYLWDSLEHAAEFLFTFYGKPRHEVWRVRVNRAALEPDDGYYEGEVSFGHAFKVRRPVPPSALTLVPGTHSS